VPNKNREATPSSCDAFKGVIMQSKSARSRSILRFPELSPSRRWLLLAVVLVLPSCAGGLNTVHGTVLYDGKPIKNAVVTFHPKSGDNNAMRPTGVTDEHGVFSLSTQKDTGAPAGEYLVTVLWLDDPAETGDKMQMGMPERTDRFKGRYADPQKSGMTAVIKSGANELKPFELAKVD
jgi:hypothetical protein